MTVRLLSAKSMSHFAAGDCSCSKYLSQQMSDYDRVSIQKRSRKTSTLTLSAIDCSSQKSRATTPVGELARNRTRATRPSARSAA